MSSSTQENTAELGPESEIDLSEYPDEDTFRILLVTDTHLGYLERDEIRKYDSFRAFDEALSIAQKFNVDFVLHAGDLFHHNQPSRFTILKTLHILRKHCMGHKPIHFQIVSDQKKNFSNGCVNYEDPDYNISLPIFMIHGNHDDPAGFGNHTPLELLFACNFINYFGRMHDLDNIQIFPILLKKMDTLLALYGLGYIRDERLHRAFLHQKVSWIRPKKEANSNWFNIGIVHQNRIRHSTQYKDCLPEEFLPKFLDIIYWGHEHECRIDLEDSLTGNFYITQPGSTIATSLSQSESSAKYVGIMEIKGEQCRIVPIKLKSNRAFIFDDIVLDDHFETDVDIHDINEFLIDKVCNMVDIGNKKYNQSNDNYLSFVTNYTESNASGNALRLPLIRLRVEYSGFPKIRSTQFGQNFVSKVANPEDILLFYKKKKKSSSSGKNKNESDINIFDRDGGMFNVDQAKSIPDIVSDTIAVVFVFCFLIIDNKYFFCRILQIICQFFKNWICWLLSTDLWKKMIFIVWKIIVRSIWQNCSRS